MLTLVLFVVMFASNVQRLILARGMLGREEGPREGGAT